jgi:transposase
MDISVLGARRKLLRQSNQRLPPRLATHHNRAGRVQPNHAADVLAEVDVVGMEACCGAHHLGRVFAAHGHDVRLMSPEYVRP